METNLSARTIENFGELVERQIAQLQLDEGIDLGKVDGAINTTQPKYNEPPLKVISRKFKQMTNVKKKIQFCRLFLYKVRRNETSR